MWKSRHRFTIFFTSISTWFRLNYVCKTSYKRTRQHYLLSLHCQVQGHIRSFVKTISYQFYVKTSFYVKDRMTFRLSNYLRNPSINNLYIFLKRYQTNLLTTSSGHTLNWRENICLWSSANIWIVKMTDFPNVRKKHWYKSSIVYFMFVVRL